MNKDELEDGASKTVWEFVPLDKLLPKETVLYLFRQKYDTKGKKSDFMQNSSKENRRVRESYWSMFACVALDLYEKKEHLLYFPSDPSNDVTLFSEIPTDAPRQKMNAWKFDVKEYTNYSVVGGFGKFTEEVINPARTVYGVIVGIHADIGEVDPASLFFKGNEHGVILVYNDRDNDGDPMKARVVFIWKGGVVFNEKIDLWDRIKTVDTAIIYHNNLRMPLV